MRNKSKLMKNLIVFFVLLIIVLITLILFLIKYILKDRTKETKVIRQTITEKVELKNIDNIVFDFKNISVNFYNTEDENIIIKQTGKSNELLLDINTNKNKITIKENSKNIFVKLKYKIYLPNTYKNSISINNAFGELKIKNLYGYTILNNNSGNVSIDNVENIEVENTSGKIKIKNIFNSIKASSLTGDFIINRLDGKIKIETITGDLIIKEFDVKEESNIETTSGDIDLTITKTSSCLLKINTESTSDVSKDICINGNNNVYIKNVTGNINIE